MELIDVMLKRKSIRKYKAEVLPEEAIEKILKAGRLAPSSRNRKSCELIAVTDKDTLEKLSKAKTSGSGMLSEAACAIVAIGDSDKSDVWIEDCSIAMTYMHLAATDLVLGSCWVQCREREADGSITSEEYIRELLKLEDNLHPEAILAVGVPDE
jgi:nitroreductase